MILLLVLAVFCGAFGASEPLEGCKWLVDLGYPEPRPVGEFIGRAEDVDGRYVLNSVFELDFSSCNTDNLLKVVAPDGVDVIGLSKRSFRKLDFVVNEDDDKSKGGARKSSAYAHFSLLKGLRYFAEAKISQFDWLSPFVDAVLSPFDRLVSFVETHIPLTEWLTFRVAFNSTTSATQYNSTTHTRFAEGGWEYREEAFRLIADDIGMDLSCDFVSGVLRIMEKVELGLDAVIEVAELKKQYGREICTQALVGVTGTFTYNSTHNTTFQNLTLVTEPGRTLRSLPCLLGFALHCSLNHALGANSVPVIIFATTQWLVIWLFGDLFAAPLPTPVFVVSGIMIWICCAASAIFVSGVISVVSTLRRGEFNWRELLRTALREISRWPRDGPNLRELLLTVLREHFGWPRLGFSWSFVLRTLVLPLALAALANVVVEKQRVQHEPVVHRFVEDFYANDTRCDVGEFTLRLMPGKAPTDITEFEPEVQRYAMLRCVYKTPIRELISTEHFPGVSWSTRFGTLNRLDSIVDHCQKPSFSSVWKAPRPQCLQKLSGYRGRCAGQLLSHLSENVVSRYTS